MGNGMDALLRASKTGVSGKETCEIQTEVMTSEFYVALEVHHVPNPWEGKAWSRRL